MKDNDKGYSWQRVRGIDLSGDIICVETGISASTHKFVSICEFDIKTLGLGNSVFLYKDIPVNETWKEILNSDDPMAIKLQEIVKSIIGGK